MVFWKLKEALANGERIKGSNFDYIREKQNNSDNIFRPYQTLPETVLCISVQFLKTNPLN